MKLAQEYQVEELKAKCRHYLLDAVEHAGDIRNPKNIEVSGQHDD